MTTERDRARLLKIARDAITTHVMGTGVRAIGSVGDARGDGDARGRASADDEPAELTTPHGGVFVTIHHRGELRGCIGHMETVDSLPRIVARCAVAACSADPRFPAVAPAELPQIQIELSLLGPLEQAAAPADVEIGRHGLVVEMGRQRGLLFPQVATERHWDAATFLSQTCRKAGLPADSWQRGAKVWRFDAEVFGDEISY
jgi:AmmeMemoRadiSam system protein A